MDWIQKKNLYPYFFYRYGLKKFFQNLKNPGLDFKAKSCSCIQWIWIQLFKNVSVSNRFGYNFWKCICIQNFWTSIIYLNLYPAKPRYNTLNISLEKSSRWNVLFECGKAAAIRRSWATSTFSKAKPKFPRQANTNLLCARANPWPNTDRAPKKIKQNYSNDSAYVSWSSKAPSATAEKLLKFVIIMVEKWFDHYFHHFFRDIHSDIKNSLDLGGGSKDLTNSFPKFFKKKLIKSTALRKHKIKTERSMPISADHQRQFPTRKKF